MTNLYIVSFSADSQQATMLFWGGSRDEVQQLYFKRFPYYHLDGISPWQTAAHRLLWHLLRRLWARLRSTYCYARVQLRKCLGIPYDPFARLERRSRHPQR